MIQLRTISLFTGVGGLDFGLEAAGFDTTVAVEMEADACRTVRLNRPRWHLLEGDIHEITSRQILDAAGLRRGEADLLVGGPPCQPFSKSGYWASGDSLRLDDARAGTLTAYLRVLRDTKPKAFLLENVPGMAFDRKSEGLRCLLDGIAEVNREAGTRYEVSFTQLNCAEYGVPQTRERVFLVGSREGRRFRFPERTHADRDRPEPLLGANLEPFTTAWDAIGDLPDDGDNEEGLIINGKWGELLPTIPEGHNYLWHTSRGGGLPLFGWRRRFWSFLLKLSKRRPSWTIQAQPGPNVGPFHWKNRRLSSREMCRLQTFPDGLTFDCSRSAVQKMLGNAVPSLMTEILGREIRRQFFEHTLGSHRLKLFPSRREPIPPPERTTPVPSCYLHLAGQHAEHPGTGKGTRAMQQRLAFEEGLFGRPS